jgi:hypothetical protein
MPEGLSPIEAGKQLQEHTSEPHQPGATLRNLATRADLSALSTRNFDSSTFTAWFTAFTLDDP